MKLFLAAALVALSSVAAYAKGKPDKETVKSRILEYPAISIEGMDLESLRAEVAVEEFRIGEVETRKKEIPCAFKDESGRARLRTTKMIPINYYRVNSKNPEAFLALKDGSGKTVWTTRLAGGEEGWDDFGADNCGHLSAEMLAKNWAAGKDAFVAKISRDTMARYAEKAKAVVDDAVFPKYAAERFELTRVKGDGYDDVNEAYEKAERAYEAFAKKGTDAASRALLSEAADAWGAALKEADLADDGARINRKIAIGLHFNLGVAKMFLNDFPGAAIDLKKSKQLTKFAFTSKGEGPLDFYERVRARQPRWEANRSWAEDDAKIAGFLSAAEARRGKVEVKLLGASDVARLRSGHDKASRAAAVEAHSTAKEESAKAVASGAENKYEGMVQHTAFQGFTLFLMPYFGQKVDSFPAEICQLTQLNDLRIAGHGIGSVPDCIGELKALKSLDLSKNNLTTLPDSIAGLKSLKSLALKKNNFSDEEQARIKGLLPDAKVKF